MVNTIEWLLPSIQRDMNPGNPRDTGAGWPFTNQGPPAANVVVIKFRTPGTLLTSWQEDNL